MFEDEGNVYLVPPRLLVNRLRNVMYMCRKWIKEVAWLRTEQNAIEDNGRLNRNYLSAYKYRFWFDKITEIKNKNRLRWSESNYHPAKIVRAWGRPDHYGKWLLKMLQNLYSFCSRLLRDEKRKREIEQLSDVFWLDKWKDETRDMVRRWRRS